MLSGRLPETERLLDVKSLNPSPSGVTVFEAPLVHDVLNRVAMTTADTSLHFGMASARIDRLTGYLASAAVALESDLIDAAIADALRQAGETLEADYAALEILSEDATSPVSRVAWTRPGAALGREPELAAKVPGTVVSRTLTLSAKP